MLRRPGETCFGPSFTVWQCVLSKKCNFICQMEALSERAAESQPSVSTLTVGFQLRCKWTLMEAVWGNKLHSVSAAIRAKTSETNDGNEQKLCFFTVSMLHVCTVAWFYMLCFFCGDSTVPARCHAAALYVEFFVSALSPLSPVLCSCQTHKFQFQFTRGICWVIYKNIILEM